MALGGGTFLVQNKILPGAYINFVSQPRALGSLGARGTVALPLLLDWGVENKTFTVEGADVQKDSLRLFGYEYTHEKLIYIRELFRGAKTAKIYRLNGAGEKAKVKIGNLTITALYGGTRGNDIKIVIEENIDDETIFDVTVYIGTIKVDTQAVNDTSHLISNDYVVFSGTGAPEPTAGVNLTGGTNKAVTGNDYSLFLDKIESESFQVLLYAGNDKITKSLFDSFTKRLRNDDGYKIVTVMHDYKESDFEGVISVKNKIADEGLDASGLVYWVAGASAGAEINQSLTNRTYNGELAIDTLYKKSQFEKAIVDGEFVFYSDGSAVRVLTDVNTFTNYESSKNSDFSSNRVIRVLDSIANDTARIFGDYYLGKQTNNLDGRNLFKAELIHYCETLLGIEAIQNFVADDINILQGEGKKDVVTDIAVQPCDSMEKLYMKVTVV